MKNQSAQQLINGLQQAAESQEDFMRELARMETGEMSEEAKQKVNGGMSLAPSPLFPGVIMGIFFPTIPDKILY